MKKYQSYIVFLAFLIASSVLWFIVKYGSDFEERVTITAQLIAIPDSIQLPEDASHFEVPVRLKGPGYQLLINKWIGATIDVDFNESIVYDGKMFNVNQPALEQELRNNLPDGMLLTSSSFNSKTIDAAVLSSKKVPLIKSFKIDYESNFKTTGSNGFAPSSVTLYGDKSILDTITSIKVMGETVLVNDTITNTTYDLSDYFKELSIKPNKAIYSVKSQRMTEGTVTVDVSIENLPNGESIDVLPESVEITYITTLEHYDKVDNKAITASIDYNVLNNNTTTGTPQLESMDSLVTGLRSNPATVKILQRQ